MVLEVSLYGDCYVRFRLDADCEIRGAKPRALIALLVTSPLGRRSRSFLQDCLWGESCYDGGRQSLRRALSDLRQAVGPKLSEIIEIDNTTVHVRLDKVRHLSAPADGPFLQGLDIGTEGFEAWLRAERMRLDATVATPTRDGTVAAGLFPRVAVAPFRPIADGRRMMHVGDWLAEDVSRSLSRSHFLEVISHLSCRHLSKARSIELGEVRSTIGADYLLYGSIRGADRRLSVDVDLVDTARGRIIATRTFQSSPERLQDLRCGLTAELSDVVSRSIVVDISRRGSTGEITDIDTHRLLVLGVALTHMASERMFQRGRECLLEASRRAPTCTTPLAWLAKWHVIRAINGWSADPAADGRAARALTARCLNMVPDCALSLTMDGLVLSNMFREMDFAGARYRQALDINPNDSLAWLLRGMQHAFSGDTSRGIELTERAHRLSPLDPFGYFYNSLRASAYCAHEDYAEALRLADHSIAVNPRHLSTLRVRIAALHGLGQTDNAKLAAQDMMSIQPDFRVGTYLRSHPAAEYPPGRRMARALRASGIPG